VKVSREAKTVIAAGTRRVILTHDAGDAATAAYTFDANGGCELLVYRRPGVGLGPRGFATSAFISGTGTTTNASGAIDCPGVLELEVSVTGSSDVTVSAAVMSPETRKGEEERR
jgi:hypothetical protein